MAAQNLANVKKNKRPIKR